MGKKSNKKEDQAEKVFAYSTDPAGYNPFKDLSTNLSPTKKNRDEAIRIQYERKGRGGKVVSVVTGIQTHPDGLNQLATLLKNKCGTGGSAKNGEIIIQGDHRDKIVKILKSEGYSNVKKSGG